MRQPIAVVWFKFFFGTLAVIGALFAGFCVLLLMLSAVQAIFGDRAGGIIGACIVTAAVFATVAAIANAQHGKEAEHRGYQPVRAFEGVDPPPPPAE
jgi:succinate-acetate transporter protein